MRLAVDPRDGVIRLTLPGRVSLAAGYEWAETQRDWIESAIADLPARAPLGPGAELPYEGRDVRVDWAPGHPRTIRIDSDRLIVGGPEDLVGSRILRWLRAEARRKLEEETRQLAARSAIQVGRIRVGDPRSRWGSCSASGDIAYSWRLLLAPPAVREATIAHELAHRRHMHHGPEFHDEVVRLLGREPKAERAWLRANAARLQAVGRA